MKVKYSALEIVATVCEVSMTSREHPNYDNKADRSPMGRLFKKAFEIAEISRDIVLVYGILPLVFVNHVPEYEQRKLLGIIDRRGRWEKRSN